MYSIISDTHIIQGDTIQYALCFSREISSNPHGTKGAVCAWHCLSYQIWFRNSIGVSIRTFHWLFDFNCLRQYIIVSVSLLWLPFKTSFENKNLTQLILHVRFWNFHLKNTPWGGSIRPRGVSKELLSTKKRIMDSSVKVVTKKEHDDVMDTTYNVRPV